MSFKSTAFETAIAAIEPHITPKSRLCVALSGGSDSVVLLHMLLHARLSCGGISAVHIEHGIRGASSQADAAFCKRLCDRLEVPLFRFSVDIPALAKKNKANIEDTARTYRRAVFEQLIREDKADFVLTAHHADDQAETVLLHILRGAGLQGLVGMRVRDGHILRPLLSVTKSEIAAYVAAHDLKFCEDETNAELSYDRNFLRHRVLPLLNDRFDVVSAFCRLSLNADSALEGIKGQISDDDFVVETDAVKIKADRLVDPLKSYRVICALERLNATNGITRKHIEAVLSLSTAQNGASVDLKKDLGAAKEYEYITLYRKTERQEEEALPFAVGMTPFLDGMLSVVPADRVFKKGRTVFDLNKIPESAVFRLRAEGDVFAPFGGGTKKLKEYLIDIKLPRRLRDLPVLADGNKVLAVVGVEIADDIKVDTPSAEVYEVTFDRD